MYLLCDYLVVSAPAVAPIAGEWTRRYYDLLDNPGVRVGRMWGYETASVDGGATILGIRLGAAGSGHDRALLAVAGAGAEPELHGLLAAIGPDVMRSPVSVRRVDFQATVEIQDDVNALIGELRPAPDYAYLRLASSAAGTEGAGLYVGSPRSDVRLRIYNKSADLERKGVLPAPGAGELLRVELILRRQAAQRALHHRVQNAERLDDLWLSHVCHRVPGLEPILARGRGVPPLPRLVDNREDRATDAWLHKAVLPAIARHYRGDREGLDEFLAAVVERWEKQPSRNSGAE